MFVVHRVTSHAIRIGALDDHIAAQIGDISAIFAFGVMLKLQWLVELYLHAVDGGDDTFFGLRAVARARLERLFDLVLPGRRRQYDSIASAPALRVFLEFNGG